MEANDYNMTDYLKNSRICTISNFKPKKHNLTIIYLRQIRYRVILLNKSVLCNA